MGWLIALVVVVLLGCVPLGVFFRYDSEGLLVRIVVGMLRFTVIPMPKKKASKKTKGASKDAATVQKEKPPAQPAEQPAPKKGGSLRDFYPMIQLGKRFLNQFRRKLRIDDLVLKLTLGGDDPCDLAVNYGRAWAALSNLVPALENFFRIRRRSFEVQCDFTSEETLIEIQAKLTVPFGQLLEMGIVYGYLFIRELLVFKKKRKGGSET